MGQICQQEYERKEIRKINFIQITKDSIPIKIKDSIPIKTKVLIPTKIKDSIPTKTKVLILTKTKVLILNLKLMDLIGFMKKVMGIIDDIYYHFYFCQMEFS